MDLWSTTKVGVIYYYTNSRDGNNTNLPLVIPADATSMNCLQNWATAWEVMLGSHCSISNADGTVYQTSQELIRACEIIAIQHKVYLFGENGMPHKLHISVDDLTRSTIRKCTRALLQSVQHC